MGRRASSMQRKSEEPNETRKQSRREKGFGLGKNEEEVGFQYYIWFLFLYIIVDGKRIERFSLSVNEEEK